MQFKDKTQYKAKPRDEVCMQRLAAFNDCLTRIYSYGADDRDVQDVLYDHMRTAWLHLGQHVFLLRLATGEAAFHSGHYFRHWCWNRVFIDHLLGHAQLTGHGRVYAIGEMVQKGYDAT